jgi:hypothetical protein
MAKHVHSVVRKIRLSRRLPHEHLDDLLREWGPVSLSQNALPLQVMISQSCREP